MSYAADTFADDPNEDENAAEDDSASGPSLFFSYSAGNQGGTGGEQTLTFLFTDIEKSGRLWRDHPRQMEAALLWHDELLKQTAQTYHGHVFKTMGDGSFLVFPNASDALHAACDAQTALHEQFGDGENDLPLRVRMAIHSGTATTRNGDFFGLSLSQTTRLLGAIHGGQIVLTQTATALTRHALPEGITLRELGQHQLRDFDRPEPLFQACAECFPCPPRPLRTESLAPPHNLPRQISSFIGREKEIGQIKRLVSASPLVTLTGPGGGGKTRLAIQVADLLLPDFEQGAFFVDLSPLSDGALIPQAVAQAVGVKEEAGKTTTETLLSFLRMRSLLLVLDNCEHLVEASAHWADTLLRGCPDLRILATSRESLGLWGETVWPVPTLALPPVGGRPVSFARLQTFEAVRLFVERAQSQNPQFRLTRPDAPHILRLCRFLDGVPLALEIAASWAGVLTPAQIADRLGDRVKLLKAGGERIALPRQKTLRAAIDWSYNLLDPKEQTLLRRLSVFAGGWTVESAEAVCADTGDDADDEDILDSLRTLAKKSLIVVDYQPSKGTRSETVMRYRMLETLRQYGQEKLSQAGETEEIARRHQAHFADFAETAEPHLRGSDQKLWLDKLEADHDNFRAALGLQTVSSDATLRIAVGIFWFWYVRGYVREGRTWLEKALAQSEGDELLRARAERAAGILAGAGGDTKAVSEHYTRALAVFERLGCLSEAASVQANLGILYSSQNEPEQAIIYLTRSLDYYREQKDTTRQAMVLLNLGVVLMNQSRTDAAENAFTEALPIARHKGDLYTVSICLLNLGRVSRLRGDVELSAEYLRESLKIKNEIDEQETVALTLLEMALTACAQNDYPHAAKLLAKADQMQNNQQTELPPLSAEDMKERENVICAVEAHLPMPLIKELEQEAVLLPVTYFVESRIANNAS